MSRAWLEEYRQAHADARLRLLSRSSTDLDKPVDPLLSDVAFNSHDRQDGQHVSPYDTGRIQIGLDGLEVRLTQGIDEKSFARVLSRATRATTGLPVPQPEDDLEEDWEEMMKGGLQGALESQSIVFEVWGASRALTHQLVRTRKAAFNQQSQRATWYGDMPECRMPESVWRSHFSVRQTWIEAVQSSWRAYTAACEAGVSYQDARYILTEGTTNYIVCTYTVREFINVFAYRGCSMFLWEMVGCMRAMRSLLVEAHPMLEPYVKISCEKGTDCTNCRGTGILTRPGGYILKSGEHVSEIACHNCKGIGSNRRCTFQGWENVEGQCDFPWARQSNRVFLPDPKYRIGAS